MTLSEIAVLFNEFMHIKKHQQKKQQNKQKSLAKLATQYLSHNQHLLPSKNIQHMDTILEEFLNLDMINEQILFKNNKWAEEDMPLPTVNPEIMEQILP